MSSQEINRRIAERVFPKHGYASAKYQSGKILKAIVADISLEGAGLIVDNNETTRNATSLELSYIDLNIAARVVNRREIPDGSLRLGIAWEKAALRKIEQDESSRFPFEIPWHLIFVRKCSNNKISLEQFRADGNYSVLVDEVELFELLSFLAWPNDHDNQNCTTTVGDDITVCRFASDSSFSIQRGSDLLYGTGDLRRHLQPIC